MTGLTSILIEGETYGLKFGMQANQMFIQHLENKFRETGHIEKEWIDAIDTGTLLYAGYRNYCTVNDLDPTKRLGFFINWVEDNYKDHEVELQRVATVYRDSKHTKQAVENINAKTEDQKKKMATLTGISSNLSVTENLGSEAIKNMPI